MLRYMLFKKVINFRQKCKAYGVNYILVRGIHKIMSFVGIYWETSYLLSQHINIDDVNEHLKCNHLMEKYIPTPLVLADFLKGDKSEFTERKLDIIKKRLGDKNNYQAWGIIYDEKLIYSCWVYKKELLLSYNVRLPMDEQALFMDDYCHPEYRGEGIHTMMNYFRLLNLYMFGIDSVAVLILTFNRFALASQLKVGFKIKQKIRVCRIGNSTHIYKKNK